MVNALQNLVSSPSDCVKATTPRLADTLNNISGAARGFLPFNHLLIALFLPGSHQPRSQAAGSVGCLHRISTSIGCSYTHKHRHHKFDVTQVRTPMSAKQ